MTYRDRREARAERLEEWAEKRQTAAVAQLNSQPELRHDWAFITQPGHIPQRERLMKADERSFRSMDKAESMKSRASGIRSQLDSSIYDDDPDAIERLEERIAGLEAQREAIKAHNKRTRGSKTCTCPDDCHCRIPWRFGFCRCKEHPIDSYVLQNLGGNIKRNRDRLEVIRRQKARNQAAEAAEGGVVVQPLSGGYVAVTFAEKPERDILDSLKAAGFRWAKGSWVGTADKLPELS